MSEPVSTYPPEQHVLRDLRIESWLDSEHHAIAEMPIDDIVLGTDGNVSLGALTTLVDLCCARVAFASAHPHWIATADLSLATGDRPASGTVQAEARLLKAGSKLIAIGVELGAVGSATANFVRIPREASEVNRPGPVVGERVSMPLLEAPLQTTIVERMDLRVVDGAAELERGDYVRNSFGTINGGVIGFLVSAAAEEATGMVAADLVLRYVGQTKVGPARATAQIVRQAVDHAVSEVRVVDAGAGELLLALATVTTVRA